MITKLLIYQKELLQNDAAAPDLYTLIIRVIARYRECAALLPMAHVVRLYEDNPVENPVFSRDIVV